MVILVGIERKNRSIGNAKFIDDGSFNIRGSPVPGIDRIIGNIQIINCNTVHVSPTSYLLTMSLLV